MKKCIAFLLCFLMVFSLFSCSADDKSKDTSTQDKESTANSQSPNTSEETTTEASTSEEAKDHILDKDEEGHFSSYESILEVYRMGINHFSSDFWNQDPNTLAADLFGTEDTTEKEWFLGIYSSATLFSSHPYKLSLGYAIKDLNGDGVDELVLLNNDYMVIAIFSMADEKPVLLANYIPRGRCWIDGNGWLHENGSNGADRSTNATYKIAKGGASLELIAEFGTNGHEFIDGVGVTKYYQLVNGEKVDITEAEYHDLGEQHGKYLGLDECAAATKEYAALTFTPLFTEAEIAMEMYKAAIKGEICVFDERLGEIKLEDCRFPSINLRLGECEILNKAILDMDGDGINEYVIQAETKDHIVLHYYNGKVYSYCFDRSNFYNLNTDGSFYWTDNWSNDAYGGIWVRGLNQIAFDGSSLSIKEIYRIKKIGLDSESHEFYVDGKQIERGEFLDYYKSRTVVIFSPLDISCEYPISSEKAYELASNHWGLESGISEGAAGTRIVHRIVILEKPNSDTLSYRICWQMEGYHNHVPDSEYSLPPYSVIPHKELFVDAITGECREYIDTEPDEKNNCSPG